MNLEGYRTYLYNIIVSALPILAAFGILPKEKTDLIGEFMKDNWETIFLLITAGSVFFRKITTGPAGKILPGKE
jgi:MFS superfamily sulfate permease-like transporter